MEVLAAATVVHRFSGSSEGERVTVSARLVARLTLNPSRSESERSCCVGVPCGGASSVLEGLLEALPGLLPDRRLAPP